MPLLCFLIVWFWRKIGLLSLCSYCSEIFHCICAVSFAVSVIGCAKRNVVGKDNSRHTSSLLGGMYQRVGNVRNGLLAKCMKVSRERMNTEV